MINILILIGLALIGIVLIFWLFFSLGVRNSRETSITDYMLAGVISMIPLFMAMCCFIFAANIAI